MRADNVITEAKVRKSERFQDFTPLAFRKKEGAMSLGMQVALEAKKGKERDSFLEPPEENSLVNT